MTAKNLTAQCFGTGCLTSHCNLNVKGMWKEGGNNACLWMQKHMSKAPSNARIEETKNGRWLLRGQCPHCRTELARFVSKADAM